MGFRARTPVRPAAALLALGLLLSSVFAQARPAYAADTSSVAGNVIDNDGVPVAAGNVSLQGRSTQNTVTDAKGAFHFAAVTPGVYTVVVSKPGFITLRTDDVAALAGETASVNVTLVPQSFSSLRTIANVSTRIPGRARINQSTAAVNTITNQTFVEQGQLQVTKALNEVPGIIAFSSFTNNASQLTAPVPQIRGALGYETESLIDGHPVSVGSLGYFSPTLISPALLQDVELVKGPGSMPTEINYANRRYRQLPDA